jgi:hypothetical protein
MLTFGKTSRGFQFIELQDANGETGGVQKSSIATEDLLWLGRDGMDRMHITQEQALALAECLMYFAEHGELPDSPQVLQEYIDATGS